MTTFQTPNEAELLLQINRGIPSDISQIYDSLNEKRQSETLTPAEHSELLKLTDQIEQLQVERVTALAALARLRQISLPDLMTSLGI